MPFPLIDSANHIVLAVHKHPDADSLGSACAFYSYLLRSQKKITLFCPSGTIDPKLSFLPWFEKITDRFPENGDCVISFDCANLSRIGIETTLPIFNIDHHASNTLFGSHNLVDVAAISTTEVVYDYFVANGIKINGKIATALYAGLLDDSHCFSAPGCSTKTFAMARDLIAQGADHRLCTDSLYRSGSLAALRMRGALLKDMKLFSDGRLALFEVTIGLQEATGASIDECKTVLDEALAMRTVQAALMVLHRMDGSIKLSLRTSGEIDAAAIMSEFGGGGHTVRAGTDLNQEDHKETVQKIMVKITKELV